jgi:hypothetical protein
MIVYGCAVSDAEAFARYAEPGLRAITDNDPDAEMIALASVGTIFRNYNLIREQVADRDDLEALVLVHQDAEIVDPECSRKIRDQLADPDVAIVGCAGAVGVRSIAWWEGAVTWASFTHRYEEMGGGEIPAVSWRQSDTPGYAKLGEVDAVDGFVMALSPWAVRNLTFDESLGTRHGYDLDICLQARSKGKKVVTADLKVVHHHSLELIEDPERWIESHIAVAEKWNGALEEVPTSEGQWQERARRAEAEAAASRLMMGAAQLQRDAAQAQLELTRRTTSWRLTAPLRRASSKLRRRR